MKLNPKDITFEPVKGGIGAGGQHSQKNATGVRATHVPTGTVVVIRGRSLKASKRQATKALEQQIQALEDGKKAAAKKQRRDEKIHDRTIVRTYAFHRGVVKDHRTGKQASIKDVLEKGMLDLLK